MSISPVQGSFLQLLVKLTRAGKILELGTFARYSTIWLARGLPDQRVTATVMTTVGLKDYDGMAIVLVK